MGPALPSGRAPPALLAHTIAACHWQLLAQHKGLDVLTSGELAERVLRAMHEPVNYKAVKTDGAARAAREIVSVMENRAPESVNQQIAEFLDRR